MLKTKCRGLYQLSGRASAWFDPQHITQLTASGSCPELQTPQALVAYVHILGEG